MVGIILASHGDFSQGILQSGSMIFGEQEDVAAITLHPSESPEKLKAKMEEAIKAFSDQDQILFLVDLWGGTPFNQANSLLAPNQDKWAIVSGLNLPMLIEAYSARLSSESAQEIATQLIESAKEGIKVSPEKLEPKEIQNKVVQEVQQDQIPAGTVIGNGKIDIVLARVDSRLLHGQVATVWTKATNPTRIIVVSDTVSKDDLRKKLIEQAAPPGVKANVIPINKMIEIAKDTRFGGTRALVLFETPEDALRVIEGGVDIKALNIGSMAHSAGKIMANKVISLDATNIATFDKLKEMQIIFDVRKVPNDSKSNMDELVKKVKAELYTQN